MQIITFFFFNTRIHVAIFILIQIYCQQTVGTRIRIIFEREMEHVSQLELIA